MQMQTQVRPQTYKNVCVDVCWYTICSLFHMKQDSLRSNVCTYYWITCTQQLDRIQMLQHTQFLILLNLYVALDMHIPSVFMWHFYHLVLGNISMCVHVKKARNLF